MSFRLGAAYGVAEVVTGALSDATDLLRQHPEQLPRLPTVAMISALDDRESIPEL